MSTRAITYSSASRIAVAALMAISRGSLLVLAAHLVFSPYPLVPAKLLRLVTLWFAVPALASWMLRRFSAATLSVESDALVLQQPGRRFEIPFSAIAGVEPWAVPLPPGGLWLRLRSGKRFSHGVQVEDPVGLIESLAAAGAPAAVAAASRHPNALYARSKNAAVSWWEGPLVKYLAFSLVPTLPLFRLHQYLSYGGTFGEYYQFGLQAYLAGFAIHWVLFAIYLLIYAAVLRAATEGLALAAARVAPSREARVRRAAEIGHRILYYVGVPVVLALRFFPW